MLTLIQLPWDLRFKCPAGLHLQVYFVKSSGQGPITTEDHKMKALTSKGHSRNSCKT